MKLVIDIDDGIYKAICDCDSPQIISHVAIKNGTPYEARPHGEWIYDEQSNVYRCSRCGHYPSRIITENGDKIFTDFNRTDSYIFCPRCGSDNRHERR